MGLLPWTFGFLALIAALSLYNFQTLVDKVTIHESIISKLETDAFVFAKQLNRKAYQTHLKLRPQHERPPHEHDDMAQEESKSLTRLLHIPALLTNKESPQKATQERIFRNLVRSLYGSQPIFSLDSDNNENIQYLFTLVFKHALENEEKFPIRRASELGNIDFEGDDPTGIYRKVFYHILKGGEGEFIRNKNCRIVSLLEFISTQKHDRCISVYLAPYPILSALFDKKEVVDEIIAYRDEVPKKLSEDGATAESIETDFRAQFERFLPSEISPQCIDFSISETYCAEEPVL